MSSTSDLKKYSRQKIMTNYSELGVALIVFGLVLGLLQISFSYTYYRNSYFWL